MENQTHQRRALCPKTHRHTVRMDDVQQARFLSMWEQSGMKSKTKFILSRIFG